jgi:hypothetical protein
MGDNEDGMVSKTLISVALSAATFVGCGSSPAPLPEAPPPPPPDPVQVATAAPVAEPPPAMPKLGPVEITAMEPPPAPAKLPTVTVTSPKPNQVIALDAAEGFEVKFDVKDWITPHEMKPGEPHKGPHVHVILDNDPYYAVFQPSAAVKLSVIAPNKKLEEGEHVLTLFPSRETHISVKPENGKSPLVRIPFWIGKKGKPTWKASDPALIYSRPKGEYTGSSAQSVVLDFYLANAELGQGNYSVFATVTPPEGEPRNLTIDRWVPFAITNLPNGASTVKLELRDKAGQPVPGAWNSTQRTITIVRDALK